MPPTAADQRPSRRALIVGTLCALAAGVLWAAVALHQMRAHGRTTVNEMRVVAGLTWMDSSKALPFAMLLLLPGLDVLVSRAKGRAHRAVIVGRVVQGLVVVSAVAGAVDFWTFPTGSYAETFESRGDSFPGQFLASAVAGLLLVVWAVMRRRGPAYEWVVLTVVGIGMVVSAYWTPALLWPAFAWAALAAWLGWQWRHVADG